MMSLSDYCVRHVLHFCKVSLLGRLLVFKKPEWACVAERGDSRYLTYFRE